MNKRRLGNSGLEVAPLAFGANVFGWTADEQTAFKLLDAFVAFGFNLIDTADVYRRRAHGKKGGESETILGNWLKRSGNREKIVIATKVRSEMDPGKKGLSRAYILRAVEDSLKRLQTDHIDLYQSHVDDPETPLEETLEAYAQLIKQGKVRAIGASNYSAERLAQALQVSKQQGLPSYQSLQPEYNLYDRANYEAKLESLCQQNGLGVISYFSLAGGYLSGKYGSEKDVSKSARRQEGVKKLENKRLRMPQVLENAGAVVGDFQFFHDLQCLGKYLNDRVFRIFQALDQVAKQVNSNPARVSMAWLLARPSITAPIASATNLEQLNDLVEGTKLQLDRSAIELLNKASAYPPVAG